MSSFISAGIIFILTLGGIWLGTLLRRTLPKHHLNEHAKDVVRLGVGLIATIAALVLGLLIGAAKGSFDTQSTQLKQITADLILVDNILAQYGPEALPIRQHMRSAVTPFADRLWREKKAATSGPFETDVAEEQVYLEIQKLSPHNDVQRSLQSRAVQVSNDLAQLRFMLFVEFGQSDSNAVLGNPCVLARDRVRELQLVFASEPDALHLPFLVCLFGGVRNFSDLGTGPTVHRTDDAIQCIPAKRPRNAVRFRMMATGRPEWLLRD